MVNQKPDLPSPYYRVSIKAIIRRAGKVLLVNEYGDHMTLPGGGIDHGEEIHLALARELKEELSFEGDPKISKLPSFVGFGTGRWDDREFTNTECCLICYEVDIEGDITAGALAKDLGFFGLEDLQEGVGSPDEIDTIRGILS